MAQVKQNKAKKSGFNWQEGSCLVLFDKANDLIQSVDSQGRYVYVNKKWCRTLGYTKKEALSLSFKDIVRKDELKHCQEIFAGLKKGKSFNLVKTIFKNKQGKDVFLEGSLSVYKKNEKEIFTIGIFRDITQRKKIKEKFEDIAELTSDWIWETDKEGKYTYVSGQFKEILGYSQKELLGSSPFDFMEPDEVKRVAKIFKKLASQKEKIKDLENWNITKKGKKICLLTNGSPLLNQKGELIGYRGADKDITPEKNLEKNLKEREEKFRAITETAQDAIVILDPERKISFWNKASGKMLGYSFEEVKGKKFYNLTRVKPSAYTPPKAKKNQFELELRRKNGSGFKSEIYSSQASIGEKDCEILIIRDITEREKFEQKIINEQKKVEKLNRQLETAMIAGNFAWWEMNLPSKKVFFSENKAEMLGYSPDKFKTYEDFTSLVHPDDYERVMKAMEDHLQGKSENYKVNYRIKSKSGDYIWFKDVGKIIEGEEKKKKKVVGVVLNISEEKKREEKIREQMKEFEDINRLMTGRELKMIELKEEIKELRDKLGES